MLKPFPFLAGGLVLLASCGTPSTTPSNPVTPPTAPNSSTPLYQVNFRMTGGATATASLRSVGKGVSAQALTTGPALNVSATPISTTTFVTSKNGVDIRHIHSTFAVTNTAAQAMPNLTFLPVIRSDNDSDPANNTQPVTVAGTPFLNVQFYDGSDASSLAATLRPVQAQNIDVSTGQAAQNRDATPFMTGLDTGGVTVAADAGLTATAQTQGWYAGSSLAAGGTTNVTFAVEFPVDRSNPKGQPFSFSLLLAAAQDVNGTGVGASVDPARVQGVLKDWTFGANEVMRSATSQAPPLVSAIAADGTVNGLLPERPGTTYPFIDNYCTFDIKGTAANFNYTTANLRAYTADDDLLGRIREYTLDGTPAYRVYSDTAGHFEGTYTCPGDLPTRVDFTLRRGWNVTVDITTATGYEWKSVTPDTHTTLTFFPATEALDVNFNDQSTLNLRAGSSTPRGVRLAQTGGISGTVTLETDVPGVTVSPSTLTLPSYSAQGLKGSGSDGGLRAQGLSPVLTFIAADDAKKFNGQMNVVVKKNGVEVGRGTLYSVSLVVPSITAYATGKFYSYGSAVPVAQNSTEIVPVFVRSVDGFNGTTTITLTGLPAGMTASTETVTLADGESRTVNITLNISSAVATGTYQLGFAGPRYDGFMGGPPPILNVVPPRTALNLDTVYGSSPAQGGGWILGADSSTPSKLVRVQNGGVVQTETVRAPELSSRYGTTLVPSVSGNATTLETGYRFTPSGSTESISVVTVYRPDGTRSSQVITDSSRVSILSDAYDNLWWSDGISLKRLELTTGAVTTVAQGSTAAMSPDGQTLTLLDRNSGTPQVARVSTASQSVLSSATVGRNVSFSGSTVTDNSGTLYGLEYGTLVRITPDGQVTSIPLSGSSSIYNTMYGFDRSNPNVLWVNLGSSIGTVDLTTQQITQKDTQNAVAGAINLSGGFTETVGYPYSGPYYASPLNP